MESTILIALRFNLQLPTIQQYVNPYFFKTSERMEKKINYLASLSLLDFNLANRFNKHHLAGVVIYLAARLMEVEEIRSKDLIREMDIEEEIFREAFMKLMALFKEVRGEEEG